MVKKAAPAAPNHLLTASCHQRGVTEQDVGSSSGEQVPLSLRRGASGIALPGSHHLLQLSDLRGEGPRGPGLPTMECMSKTPSPSLLNSREQEILLRLSAGFSDQQIANDLFLSLNTVKWYNRQIYSKLGVSGR